MTNLRTTEQVLKDVERCVCGVCVEDYGPVIANVRLETHGVVEEMRLAGNKLTAKYRLLEEDRRHLLSALRRAHVEISDLRGDNGN